ncbi:HlyD family efflux transporter periplasmic adaptor subunit [Actinoplanes sp. TBRC 11911]|uniref:efflux RND transporter periplasmic adaptor subunit n=1 Tax=Actinoplanes sp. TBRC 11911 TaxID=2729386 RepID=UPI00145F44E7|nr:efflux RND transporter periplasmic adaptor subunit [Actinoplanes sp. TBRC 11911]NMO51510.1 HlyD family efflux transporter periplasmic adaptor subunit [Actinoplanes sp. TBRC 11911]
MGEALAGRRRWIWLAAAVVVLVLIVFGVIRATGAGAEAKPAAQATAMVDRGDVSTQVATTGTVQPAQTRSLSFAVAGTVESVSVRAGTTVKEDQVLAKVDDADAAEAVDNARSALDDAETALDKAQSDASKPPTTAPSNCGRNVPAAYVSSSKTPSPSASRPSGSPTASPSPSATKARPSTTSRPTQTKAGGQETCDTTGSRQNAQGGQNPQGGQDSILSAQQRLTQANTTLQNAEDALDGATIKAPIAGKILSVGGNVGSQVGAGATFITLADTYDMQISAQFPEADADHLAVAQKAVVSLADQPGTEFKATVVQVDPTGTSDGTMVRYGVVLAFVDAPKDLLVGQSAAVKVTTGDKAGVLRVPSTAVHDVAGDTGTVLKDDTPVKVGIGLRGDQYTEITNGLNSGETVAQSW